MEIVLLILFIVSCIYCCDIPAWKGFEFLINNHDSLLYSIGVSIIASYIFYLFQVFIPRIMRFRRTRSIAYDRLYHIEKTMCQMLCCLQGETPNRDVIFSKRSIADRLDKIDVFSENSKYEIQHHKELSVFEALVYYDNKTMNLADEIITGQYLESKYEKYLLSLKKSSLHEVIAFWIDNLPGEYERRNQIQPGYHCVNLQATDADIVSSVDEYLRIYKCIKKTSKKVYRTLHSPWNEIFNKFLNV